MLDAAEAAGRVHMVMFTWRWLGVFAYLDALVAEGYLGQCRDAHVLMHASYVDAPAYAWRCDPARGGGILGDFGARMIDLARWCVGEITRVSAHLVTHVARPAADGTPMESLNDSAFLTVGFAGGAHGTIEVSGVHLIGDLAGYQIRLYGDNGSLEADVDMLTSRLRGRRRGDASWEELRVPPELTGTPGQHPASLNLPILAPLTNLPAGDRLFVDAVLGVRPARPTFADGWKVQQVIDAAVRSGHERHWVEID
jgi:predicted dehydrogenase